MRSRSATLRLLATNPGLALYVRPRRNDHPVLLGLLAEDRQPAGIVFDPILDSRQAELRDVANRQAVETVLDTLTMELSLPGGRLRKGSLELPWSSLATEPAASLIGEAGVSLVSSIADWVATKRLSAVLSPTHYITGPDDPAFAVDRRLATDLRRQLDDRGLDNVAIYYPLALPLAKLRDAGQAMIFAHRLQELDIDAIWLRLHPFGSTSCGPVSLRTYITACRALQTLGLPLVAERTGTIGVALMAFAAVSGIECGVTLGERFDVSGLIAPRPDGSAFDPQAMVYIEQLGIFMRPAKAKAFYDVSLMRSRFGCKDFSCCPKGPTSTLGDPRRHGVIRRIVEVEALAAVPQELRPDQYLENFLRPATDAALQAVKVDASLEPARRRLDGVRVTLGALRKRGRPTSFVPPPSGRRAKKTAKQRPRPV
jgi:hypothetical protein